MKKLRKLFSILTILGILSVSTTAYATTLHSYKVWSTGTPLKKHGKKR